MSFTALLGFVFLGLSIITTFLMYQFWGYPYDKEARTSECPQWKMNIHRVCGFAYAAVYVVMMIQMVPRMWQYQIEFPARTVAHIMLGLTIGVLLLVKLSILRWFRHFEEWMPVLGTGLLLCTFLLTGLSLPFAVREHTLGDAVYSADNLQRVGRLLEGAGLPEGTDTAALATESSLRAGRSVLLSKCVYCHDLKTAIARPRTPADWARTVERMADKPTLGGTIDSKEGALVTAYLVAITPDLQQSMKAKRAEKMEKQQAMAAVKAATQAPTTGADGDAGAAEPSAKPPVDLAKAKAVFEDVCSQCHDLGDVDGEPPDSLEDTATLMKRMVENGMEEDEATLELIRAYLVETYVNKKR